VTTLSVSVFPFFETTKQRSLLVAADPGGCDPGEGLAEGIARVVDTASLKTSHAYGLLLYRGRYNIKDECHIGFRLVW
jgi:hypothetical protein